MPEASARRLPYHIDTEPGRVLRVVRDPESPGHFERPRVERGSERRDVDAGPGRAHPRSRVATEGPARSRVLEDNAARVAAATAPRTIVVTGQGAAGVAAGRSRTADARRGATGRTVERPDRLALWAVGLGLVLAFMAAATAQADAPAPATPPPVTAAR